MSSSLSSSTIGNQNPLPIDNAEKLVYTLPSNSCCGSRFYIPNDIADKVTDLIIPSSVTEITDSAFHSMPNLRHVDIASTVTSIGNYAFFACELLECVIFRGMISRLPRSVFELCVNLSKVDFKEPNSILSIDDNAFRECRSLASFTIPPNTKSIDDSAFTSCSSLVNVDMEHCKQLKFIKKRAFYGCEKLGVIVFPESLVGIGEEAFGDCYSMQLAKIPKSVMIIDDDAFENCRCLGKVFVSQCLLRSHDLLDTTFTNCSGNSEFSLCVY